MIRTSDAIDAISAAWVEAAAEMPNIKKAGTSNFGAFVPLHEVVDTVRPILAEHGLAYIQGLCDGEKFVTITTRLIHKSGQWFEDSMSLPNGSGTAQAAGSAVTYGRRYSLMAILGLAGEDDDGAAASETPRAPRKAAAPRAQAAPKGGANDRITNGKATQIVMEMNKHGISKHDDRTDKLTQILGHTIASTNDLTNAQAEKVMEYLTASST